MIFLRKNEKIYKNLLTKRGEGWYNGSTSAEVLFCMPIFWCYCPSLSISAREKSFSGGRQRGFDRRKKFNGGGAVMRVKITLVCCECKQRNYDTVKNKKNDPDRLEMKKYCRFCRKHTVHKESK